MYDFILTIVYCLSCKISWKSIQRAFQNLLKHKTNFKYCFIYLTANRTLHQTIDILSSAFLYWIVHIL